MNAQPVNHNATKWLLTWIFELTQWSLSSVLSVGHGFNDSRPSMVVVMPSYYVPRKKTKSDSFIYRTLVTRNTCPIWNMFNELNLKKQNVCNEVILVFYKSFNHILECTTTVGFDKRVNFSPEYDKNVSIFFLWLKILG